MKLEALASGGEDVLRMEPQINGGILQTTPMITSLFEQREKARRSSLAYSAEEYIARGMAEMAIDCAGSRGTKDVGFSGGVAYNGHIVRRVKDEVEKSGLKFHVNSLVPSGDGGISLGQAHIASLRT
jgi:hydrogenase maturation protein HypF